MCPIHHLGKSKKRMRDRLRLVTFRIHCYLWTTKDGAGPHAGFGFASDVSEEGAGLYLNLQLPKATPVLVSLEDEKNEGYKGLVVWSRRYATEQRFHGQATQDYRVGVQFLFDSETDRQRYLMFYKDLQKRAASVPNQYKF